MDEKIINKLTISGFRGIIGEELTADSISVFALGFVKTMQSLYSKQKLHILIGRDGRTSGQEIEQTLVQILTNYGIDVTVGGILTTPSILHLTRTFTFDGAIIITASHNPKEYNGLKFIMSDGHFANKETINSIKENIRELDELNPAQEKGTAILDNTLGSSYVNHIVSCFTKLKTHPRVIVDTVNSSGSIMAPEFLRALGAETIAIHDEPIGEFARPPEPNPAALKELGRATLGYSMDVGFGLDPDGDRLVIVDENGIPVFEEYTIALCAKAFYEKLKQEDALSSAGPLVINMSTSRTVIDVAMEYGVKTVMSPVGEPNVVKKMIEINSMFGGEGSGGVIFRPINFGRDSFVGMALILNLMENTNKKISELANDLHKYVMHKEKIEGIENFEDYKEAIKDLFPDAEINIEDGIRFDFPDNSWVLARPSNTEPIIRIFGEAQNEDRIVEIINKIKVVLNK